MILYRLTKARFKNTAWTGQGAKEAGGRWNSVGTAMVYASETASLTMLETLVHLHAASLMDSYCLLSINVPDDLIESLDPDALPKNWDSADAPKQLSSIGDQWIASNQAVALSVPSALSPVENNFLLNPLHPEYQRIIGRATEIAFHFDERLK